MEPEKRAYYEKLQEDALAGRCIGGEGSLTAQECQRIVEDRCQNVLRNYGVTFDALKRHDPDAYDRLIRGHHGALVREGMVKRGQLSNEWLRRSQEREEMRRRGVEIAQFDDFGDSWVDERADVPPEAVERLQAGLGTTTRPDAAASPEGPKNANATPSGGPHAQAAE